MSPKILKTDAKMVQKQLKNEPQIDRTSLKHLSSFGICKILFLQIVLRENEILPKWTIQKFV